LQANSYGAPLFFAWQIFAPAKSAFPPSMAVTAGSYGQNRAPGRKPKPDAKALMPGAVRETFAD
jgi:hypothetical protein